MAAHEFSGSLSLESRWYPETAVQPGQRAHASGFVAEPKLYLEDSDGRGFTLAPFFRTDSADSSRTHADLREAYLLLYGEAGDGEWELRMGVDRVFWGVAESRHLVDIVNQTDLVEHPDEKAKLGQPMAHLTWSGDWGAAELFALPYHRARTFPGRRGRLRLPLVVDNDRVSYESAAGAWHLDFAARYSHGFGPLDLSVSLFVVRRGILTPYWGLSACKIDPPGFVLLNTPRCLDRRGGGDAGSGNDCADPSGSSGEGRTDQEDRPGFEGFEEHGAQGGAGR